MLVQNIVPRSESMSKMDKPKRNMMQPHVPSDKVPHKEHHDGKHSEIPVTREGQAHPKGSNAKDSRPYHEGSPRYPENSMGIDNIQPMTRHPVVIQVRRYEDEDQSERM